MAATPAAPVHYAWDRPEGTLSACWNSMVRPYVPTGSNVAALTPHRQPEGFRLGINLLSSPSPGDFLPPAATIGESAVCLLPPGAAGAETGWQGLSRPTIEGQVDLITGLPLVKVTDLELPFDGATFRLARTRSGTRRDTGWHSQAEGPGYVIEGVDRWWDWTGSGWMIGENPILLIDSTNPSHVAHDVEPTCWLILDAHHSIPFQRVRHGNTVSYEAPPRFRARLTSLGGDWNPTTLRWTVLPAQYEVWLYDGQIKYTFVATNEDVPDHLALHYPPSLPAPVVTSAHERPYSPNDIPQDVNNPSTYHDPWSQWYNPGLGIPYYALCNRIEDRYGHIVEIQYCASRQGLIDDPITGCDECQQDCVSKGQISSVKLKYKASASAPEQVRWTLVYCNRLFKSQQAPSVGGNSGQDDFRDRFPENEANARLYSLYGASQIDTIYAFQQDIAPAQLSGLCLTISHLARYGACTDGDDPLLQYNTAHGQSPLPTAWRHRVRYLYDTVTCDTVNGNDGYHGTLQWPPTLVRTVVDSRDPGATPASPDAVRTRNTIFRYADTPAGGNPSRTIPWLQVIFTQEDLDRMVAAATPHAAAAADDPGLAWLLGGSYTVALGNCFYEQLSRWRTACGGLPMEPGVAEEASLLRYASARFEPISDDLYPLCEEEKSVGPSAAALLTGGGNRHYLRQPGAELCCDNDRTSQLVGSACLRSGVGGTRFYRINRFMVAPQGLTGAADCVDNGIATVFVSESGAGVCEPMASAFVVPYRWQPHKPSINSPRSLSDAAVGSDLSRPRWVVVIDEFASVEALLNLDSGNGGENYTYAVYTTTIDGVVGVKSGQISRRVVEINASGVVLGDRRWAFGGDQAAASGVALGEEFTYERAADYGPFAGALSAPDVPASLRDELLLVQRRSVGWSALPDLDQPTRGRVDVYRYRLFEPPAVPEGETRSWDGCVQLEAEGVQQGSAGGNTLWTKQYFRNAAAPAEVTCEVEFTAARTDLLGVDTPPPRPAPAGMSARHTITDRISEAGVALSEQRVRSRTVISPQKRLRPGGPWYFPVEREFYTNGSAEWAASGLLQHPDTPAQDTGDELASLTYTYYKRDEQGRSVFTALNAQPGGLTPPDGGAEETVPAYPDPAWPRIGEASPANCVTWFRYDEDGLSDMYLPNGRRWARRVVLVPREDTPSDKVAQEYVFNNLAPYGVGATLGAGPFRSGSPGEVKVYRGRRPAGTPSKTLRVAYVNSTGQDSSIELAGCDEHTPRFTELWRVQLGVDANGRVRDASLLEKDAYGADMAIGTKTVNDLVDVLREQEIDGTVTRTTRDPFGHPLRTYVGTDDTGWDRPGGLTAPNNMALVERVEYGVGATDAWLPKVVRRYRNGTSWAPTPHGAAPSSDTDGLATVTRYDWRMRAVRVDSYAKGDPLGPAAGRPPSLSTTLTYLDHADRPTMTATFGPGAPDEFPPGLDPATLADDRATPSPGTLLAQTGALRPTSLSTTVYGPDGSASERRVYDAGWNGSAPAMPPYAADYQFSGKGGQQLFTQRPGQPVQITTVDALNRVLSSASVSPGRGAAAYSYELTRTDFRYDANGNVNDTRRFDRTADAGDALVADGPAANAVRTRTVSWYDDQKRLVATADLGSEQAGGLVPGAPSYTLPTPADAPALTVAGGVATATRAGLPASAMLRLFTYDKKGNQVLAMDPGGAVTASEYDSAGRLTAKIENAYVADTRMARRTAYRYQYGRLVEIKAQRAKETFAPASETTRVDYFDQTPGQPLGADIVDDAFRRVSLNNGLIKRMRLPNAATGETGQTTDVRLRYTFSGQVAERTDGRGVTFRYRYDALGRLASVQIGYYLVSSGGAEGDFVAGYPGSMTASTGAPVDRVEYLEYTYDAAGNLADVVTWGFKRRTIVTHNRFAYDARGDLASEVQSYGQLITAQNQSVLPKIRYTWDYRATGPAPEEIGRHRPTSITYPHHVIPFTPPLTDRVVTLGYGPGETADDRRFQIASITTSPGAPAVASFAHTGGGRRISASIAGGAITQSLACAAGASPPCGGAGLPGLDPFGRVQDLKFLNTTGQTLFQAQYTYDASGNRLTAQLTQAPVGGVPQANTRSQLNTYDGLNRLVGTDVGAITWAAGSPSIAAASRARSDTWSLDLLGNWVGGAAGGTTGPPTQPGRASTGNLDGYGTPWALPGATPGEDTGFVTHAINARNAITGTASGSGAPAPPPPPTTAQFRTDAAGNLVYDGEYFYQYDAWGRLLQVNKGSLAPGAPPGTPVTVGVLVKHHTYDGLGRLVRTQSPYPGPQEPPTGWVRSERYFYDGLRRVQEVATDPLIGLDGGGGGGTVGAAAAGGAVLDPALVAAAVEAGALEPELDGAAAPMVFEEAQLAAAGSGPPTMSMTRTYLAREYVYGAGDGWGGMDEALVQYDEARQPAYPLQDAGGDLAALCWVQPDAGGGVSAQVLAQWTYDAYGAALTLDLTGGAAAGYAPPHFGHKGLFLDRLDSPAADAYGGELPRLVPFAHAVYQVRNRAYSPGLGRFLQMDPNASAMVLLEEAWHGSAASAQVGVFDLQSRFKDGPNLYGYLRSNPATGRDPMGLFEGSDLTEWTFDVDLSLPTPGDLILGTLTSLVGEYSANLEWDVDWATDWDRDDNGHTRSDSKWVVLAIGQGLHDAFDFGIGDIGFNPLDLFAAGVPGAGPGAANALAKGLQNHHIATNKGKYAGEFADLFARAGMTLEDPANIVRVPHGGRHPAEYHKVVYQGLEGAIEGKSGSAARSALKAELKRWEGFIKRNPHFLYNTSGGRPTAWRGVRHLHAPRGRR